MAAFEDQAGVCRVCRRAHAKLSFEHVPPKAAFNDTPTVVYGLDDWLQRDEDGKLSGGRIAQRGPRAGPPPGRRPVRLVSRRVARPPSTAGQETRTSSDRLAATAHVALILPTPSRTLYRILYRPQRT
jgi:hypothetical protein